MSSTKAESPVPKNCLQRRFMKARDVSGLSREAIQLARSRRVCLGEPAGMRRLVEEARDGGIDDRDPSHSASRRGGGCAPHAESSATVTVVKALPFRQAAISLTSYAMAR
jgi:hypothetical protein